MTTLEPWSFTVPMTKATNLERLHSSPTLDFSNLMHGASRQQKTSDWKSQTRLQSISLMTNKTAPKIEPANAKAMARVLNSSMKLTNEILWSQIEQRRLVAAARKKSPFRLQAAPRNEKTTEEHKAQ